MLFCYSQNHTKAGAKGTPPFLRPKIARSQFADKPEAARLPNSAMVLL
jgi:hypothetical protein